MRKFLILTFLISLFMNRNVFSDPIVSIIALGGDDTTNAGYVVTIEKINLGDTLVFNVTRGGSLVDSRSVQATGSFYENRHIFATQTTSGMHEFIVTLNGSEIYKQEHRVSLGTGAMDSLNGGSISALSLNRQSLLNQPSTIEVSLTGIERYAEGDVTVSIQGKGVAKATGTGPIVDQKSVIAVDIVPTDSTIKKLEVTAEWGQRGYTKIIDFPFSLTTIPEPEPIPPEPEPAPEPQLPKTGDKMVYIPIILFVGCVGGLCLARKRKIPKERG